MKALKLFSIVMMGMAITLASCSGEDGLDGKNGDPGTPGNHGTNGEDGLACWDLNGNGIGDAPEDVNDDGNFDALDCQGTEGLDGTDGEDKPNVDFYFQNGFKGYNGAQDAHISSLFPDENYNDEIFKTGFLFANPGNYGLIRFDGIDVPVVSSLVEEGEDCSESFFVNQATLYLYIDSYSTNFLDTVSLFFGFYGDNQDPVFEQTDVNWTMANANDPWFVEGAISALWAGPFPGTDAYSIELRVDSDSFGRIGWVGVPVPRSVAEQWLCVPESNKGVRVRADGDDANVAGFNIISSENDKEDLRPVLVIETEKIDPASANKSAVGSSKKTNWEDMTYEEKMAPLYRFLSSK